MGEEEKEQLQESEATEDRNQTSLELETEQRESNVATEADSKPSINNGIAARRGRLVASGIIVAAVGTVIAVGVAAIFQITSMWLVKCPKDVPINDPARVLWSDVLSDHVKKAPLGVPEKLAKETSLKSIPASTK